MSDKRPAGKWCIIYNPTAGRGRAQRSITRLKKLHRVGDSFRATTRSGQAEELAYQAAQGEYEVIVAAGGDGTVHEVANGILRSGNNTVVFAPWPIGSANDYAFALGLTPDWPMRPDLPLQSRRVDAGLLKVGAKSRFFVNGIGIGFNAGVTAESRRIPYLRGMALYGLAFLMAVVRRYRFLELDITIDSEKLLQKTLALTINIGPREGGFLVTPGAHLDDGMFDIVRAGPIQRLEALSLLPKLIQGHLPTNHPALQQRRGRRISIRSPIPLPIHLDGELVDCPPVVPCEVAIDLLPSALTVLAAPTPAYFVS